MSDDFADAMSKALRRAYSLGQTYWQQADSESYSQNRKADDTSRKFAALVDETIALARSGQAASGSSQGARWHAGWLVSNSEGDEEFVNNESALAGRHYKGGAPLALTASFERSDVQNGVGQPEAPTAAPLDPAALVAECAPYLKEGETPLQRIQRDSKDMEALLTLLSREKLRSMDLAEKLAARSGAGSEEGQG